MGDEEELLLSARRLSLYKLTQQGAVATIVLFSTATRDARGFILDDTLTALCSLCVQALAPQTALASPGQ